MADGWISVEAHALPPLKEDEVQVWRVELPKAETPPRRFLHLLCGAELARAERLRAGRVRLQFVVARACLRTLLGNVLAVDPKLVAISQSSYGKPETPGVLFNVAHSGATILIALCREHRVGVDVEYFSRATDELAIARHSFAAAEQRALLAIADPEELRRAFFRCWTRKEAVIKADGRGLSLGLDSFEVPVGDMAETTRVRIPADAAGRGGEFYLTDLPCGGEVAAALATGARCGGVRRLDFPLEATFPLG